MRRILIDRARQKASAKHGGRLNRRVLDDAPLATNDDADDLLALDEALTRLAEADELAARLVRLRYFAGLTTEQSANALGISTRSAYYTWNYARAWLKRAIRGD
jgi:RNA polymerase sigma factor (TIGR02999 family)